MNVRLYPSLLAAASLAMPIAAIAADPTSMRIAGNFSSNTKHIDQIERPDDALELVSTFDLPLAGKERPEGVAYLSRTRLAVVTEGPARLLELRVTRGRAARV